MKYNISFTLEVENRDDLEKILKEQIPNLILSKVTEEENTPKLQTNGPDDTVQIRLDCFVDTGFKVGCTVEI